MKVTEDLVSSHVTYHRLNLLLLDSRNTFSYLRDSTEGIYDCSHFKGLLVARAFMLRDDNEILHSLLKLHVKAFTT